MSDGLTSEHGIEISEYMRTANSGRQRSFMLDGVSVTIGAHEDDDRGKAVAVFLADARETTERLRAEVQKLRALVPDDSARLLGPGCVRMRDGKIWLLNRADSGWASWGVQCSSWDDLFRRFNVIVTEKRTDSTGEFWVVVPQ